MEKSSTASSPPPADPTTGDNSDQEAVNPAPTLPLPDQGVAAWATVVGGFCLLFASFGWVTCIGVFQSYYQTHQLSAYSSSDVAWISSVETFMVFILGPIIGRLFDDHGPRWLLIVGTIMHPFGLFMTSLCTEYYQFILAQSFCSAGGASLLFLTGTTAVSTWFVRHRALALGLTVAGSSIGGIVFPIMVDSLVPQIGFPWTIRACAFLILGLCIFGTVTVTSRLQHAPRPFVFSNYWRPLRELPFATFSLAYLLFYLGLFVPFNFIILEAERYGMAPSLAAYLVSIMNAGGLLGRIAPGWLADRIGSFNVMIIIMIFTPITVLALWIPGTSNGAIIAFSVLYGFGTGAFISLTPAILAQISPIRELGARLGTCYAFTAIASLISNPIAGALVPNTLVDPFWKLQVYTGMLMLGGGAVMIVARIVTGGSSVKKGM